MGNESGSGNMRLIGDDDNLISGSLHKIVQETSGIGVELLSRVDEWWEVDVGTAMMRGLKTAMVEDAWELGLD